MTDITKVIFHKTRRKGVSLIECLILIIVLIITAGAIFNTMAWAVNSYTSSKSQKEARTVLFTWVQTFGSMWPTPALKELLDEAEEKRKDDPSFKDTGFEETKWITEAGSCFKQVCVRLWGDNAWDDEQKLARGNGFIVNAQLTKAPNEDDGTMTLAIAIESGGGGGRPLVDLERRYNIYNNDRVSDDVIQG